MVAKENPTHVKELAQILLDSVDKVLSNQGNFTYSQDPESSEKEIIEYASRMRVFGMEKFNDPCIIAVINYYKDEEQKKTNHALGALVIYFSLSNLDKFLKNLNVKIGSDEEEAAQLEACKEAASILSEKFFGELTQRYKEIIQSEPQVYLNNVPEGVAFSFNELQMGEVNFYMWKTKVLSLNLTMAPLP